MADRRGGRHRHDDDTDTDEEETLWVFVEDRGIELESLAFYTKEYIDENIKIRPGAHPRNSTKVGWLINTTKSIGRSHINDIQDDSAKWKRERRSNRDRGVDAVDYSDSKTARDRRVKGPTESSRSRTGTSSSKPSGSGTQSRRHAPSQALEEEASDDEGAITGQMATMSVSKNYKPSSREHRQGSRIVQAESGGQPRSNTSSTRIPTLQSNVDQFYDDQQPMDDPRPEPPDPDGTLGWSRGEKREIKLDKRDRHRS